MPTVRSLLWIPALLALAACDGGDATDASADTDAADDTPVDTEDTTGDTPADTEDTPGDTEDTPADTEDTPTEEPYTNAGTWTLTGGTISAVGGSSPPCPAVGQDANPEERTLTWTEDGAIQVDLENFAYPWDCTLAGPRLSCTTTGNASPRGNWFELTSFTLTMTLGAEGVAVVDMVTSATCDEIAPGGCAGAVYCPSHTATWSAVHD